MNCLQLIIASDSDYDIDIEQLNKDIDIINETLNMHIKKF